MDKDSDLNEETFVVSRTVPSVEEATVFTSSSPNVDEMTAVTTSDSSVSESTFTAEGTGPIKNGLESVTSTEVGSPDELASIDDDTPIPELIQTKPVQTQVGFQSVLDEVQPEREIGQVVEAPQVIVTSQKPLEDEFLERVKEVEPDKVLKSDPTKAKSSKSRGSKVTSAERTSTITLGGVVVFLILIGSGLAIVWTSLT